MSPCYATARERGRESASELHSSCCDSSTGVERNVPRQKSTSLRHSNYPLWARRSLAVLLVMTADVELCNIRNAIPLSRQQLRIRGVPLARRADAPSWDTKVWSTSSGRTHMMFTIIITVKLCRPTCEKWSLSVAEAGAHAVSPPDGRVGCPHP